MKSEAGPTPHDAHPFEAPSEGFEAPREGGEASDARCLVCGERRGMILHHPTRVRAARAIRALGQRLRRQRARD